MRTISNHYGITGNLPFLDVAVDSDNLEFVDLHAIRLSDGPEPYRSQALESADGFMREVVDCYLDGSPAALERGRTLLANFREPWETRLGMSRVGFFGRGGSSGVGDDIWTALSHDVRALVEVGMLNHIERIPLFVEGVGSDICSDLTTRIIFSALADFTAEMMVRFPELKVETVAVPSLMWDAETSEWTEREVTLPAPLGQPLLLVPTGWARRNPLMSASRYHGVSVLGYVQDAEAHYSPMTRRMIKSPKEALAKRDDLRAVHPTNLRITLDALKVEDDLLADFEAYVADWYLRQSQLAA